MIERLLRVLLAAVALGALGAWFTWEFNTGAQLHAMVFPLREEALQLGKVAAENRLLRANVARISGLRRQQADEINSLALQRAEATHQPAPGFKPAGEWRNSGNATPTQAYETYIWAVDRAEIGVLAGVLGMGSEARAKVAAIFASLSDDARATYGSPEIMFALLFANRNPVWFSAVDVMGQGPDQSGTVMLTVDLQYAGGQVREHRFYASHFADGWKRRVSDGEVDYILSSQLGIGSSDPK